MCRGAIPAWVGERLVGDAPSCRTATEQEVEWPLTQRAIDDPHDGSATELRWSGRQSQKATPTEPISRGWLPARTQPQDGVQYFPAPGMLC